MPQESLRQVSLVQKAAEKVDLMETQENIMQSQSILAKDGVLTNESCYDYMY